MSKDIFARYEKETLVIGIPLVCPTLNKWYAGTHWAVRRKLAETWHQAIEVVCKKSDIDFFKGKYPVSITTQTFFKGGRSKRDTSNCFPANKLAEDGLVKAGIIPEDNIKYVATHTVLTPIYNNGFDMTLIKIKQL